MSYIGSEETQKEAKFFDELDIKQFSLNCITGDFDRKLGFALCFTAKEGFENHHRHDDPIYLSTARGDFRMFKTVDAAVSLMMSKGVSDCNFYFDPR